MLRDERRAHRGLPGPAGRASSLRRGEILGLAGLVGAGRSELARAVFGIDRRLGGEVRLDGEPSAIDSPRDAIDRGIYLVPEDRKRSGLLLDVSIAENISLPDLASYARGPHRAPRRRDRERRAAADAASASRRRRSTTAVGSLSGGNQQKVVLAKWLSMRPRVVIFDEPTRGIDVGAKSEIYALMRDLADRGRRDPDDLQRHGGGDRRERPHRRDARGRASAGFLERGRFSEHNVLQLAVGKRARAGGSRMLKKDLGLLLLILVVGAVGGGHQPALPVADQPLQHRQPDRPVRPVLARPRPS